jgi:hypothetical protein
MAHHAPMLRLALGCASLALICAPFAGAGAEPCLVCASGGSGATTAPLTIEIVSDLEFSRMALTGRQDGHARIDPQTGSRRIDGGLVPLGGLTFKGRARVIGEPMRPVRIDLPPTITMTAAGGAKAELSDLVTDLPAFPVLDSSGRLEFGFGGRLTVTGGGGGNFRARIPISVDYN